MIFPGGKSVDANGAGFDQYDGWQKYGFTSPTTIESTIYSTPDETSTMGMTVVEFADGIINTIQSGSSMFNPSFTSLSVTISEVPTGSSAVFVYGAVSDEAGSTPNDPEYSTFTSELTSPTQLTFRRGQASPGTEPLIVNWAVVEFT